MGSLELKGGKAVLHRRFCVPATRRLIRLLTEGGSKGTKKSCHFRISSNGTLCRAVQKGNDTILLPYIPRALRRSICESNHDSVLSGHIGFQKTYAKIYEKYYWPGMFSYIKKYVESCPDCQALKSKPGVRVGYLQPIVSSKPWCKVGIDIVGPLPVVGDKRYIIASIDLLTKWIETQNSNTSAKTTAKFISEQVSRLPSLTN